jgi:hypothetical protein
VVEKGNLILTLPEQMTFEDAFTQTRAVGGPLILKSQSRQSLSTKGANFIGSKILQYYWLRKYYFT